MEKSKIKSAIESSVKVIEKLREVDDAAELKMFIETSPFASTRAAYSHLINGLFATMSPADLASAFKLPEFLAADLKAAATAELVMQLKEEGGKRAENTAQRIVDILGAIKGSKGKNAEEAAQSFNEKIKEAFKAAGIDANIETEVINLGEIGKGRDGIKEMVRGALAEAFGGNPQKSGCGDPECPACQLGRAVDEALQGDKISPEEMMMMASESEPQRAERTMKMAEEIHAGRPALDVLLENVKEVRAAQTH